MSTHRLSVSFALCGALLLIAFPAAAEPAWPAMVKAGMTGTWAEDCGTPAHLENQTDTYYGTATGKAGYRSNRGEADGIANVTIVEAKVLSPTTIRTLLRYDDPAWGKANGLTFDTINEITTAGGVKKMRTLKSTRPSDGKVLIDNGKVVANGQAIGAQKKCSD